jgi:hypothetical protein
MLNKLLDRLTDNYNKHTDSNIGKLFQIISGELEEVKKVFQDIKTYQDLDIAIGKTLDNIGKNVLEYRSTDNDELYRQLIKTKIIANLSQGDIETINEVAKVLVGDGFAGIKETWNDTNYDFEPAGLVIKLKTHDMLIPYDAIERVIAGGVRATWELGIDTINIGLRTKQEEYQIFYNMCGTFLCGTKPYIQNEGISFNTRLNVNTNKTNTSQRYKMTGTFKSGEAKL